MNIAVFISSFVLGIGGSLHCLGMCGPLALSIPFAAKGASKWLRIIAFYLAKAIAYGSIGALFGILGKGLLLMEWQQGLSVVAGVFIIILVCLPVLKPGKGNFLFRKQFAFLYDKLNHSPRLYYFILLGFLNGFLPCGLVYTALAAATVSGSVSGGFLSMFLFGIGTIPALVLLIVAKNKISFKLRSRLKPVSVMISICIGLLLILRGMNLGIPYVSPEYHEEKVSNCCHRN